MHGYNFFRVAVHLLIVPTYNTFNMSPIFLPFFTFILPAFGGIVETDELVLTSAQNITLRFEFGVSYRTPGAGPWFNCSVCVDCDTPLEQRPLPPTHHIPFEPCPESVELFTKLELKELQRVMRKEADSWMSVYTLITNEGVLQVSRSVTTAGAIKVTRKTFYEHMLDAVGSELVLESVENERHFPPNEQATFDPTKEANWLEVSWNPKTVERKFISGMRKGWDDFKVVDYETKAKLREGVRVKDVIHNLAELSFLQVEGCRCIKKSLRKKGKVFPDLESVVTLCRELLTTRRDDHKAATRLYHTCLSEEKRNELWPPLKHPFHDPHEL